MNLSEEYFSVLGSIRSEEIKNKTIEENVLRVLFDKLKLWTYFYKFSKAYKSSAFTSFEEKNQKFSIYRRFRLLCNEVYTLL